VALISEDVVPVCSPRLLGGRAQATPDEIAEWPLLQQSTRPDAWRQWFEAVGVTAAQPLRGPRYELFSMTATAAAHGLGVALMPRILIEDDLLRGDLVVACDRPLRGERSYYLVAPVLRDPPPALAVFERWLLERAEDGVA
jgi:LysR family glycine cleavage system transcriptional activator